MKKRGKFIFIGLLVSLAIIMIGCSFDHGITDPGIKNVPFNERVCLNSLESNLARVLWHQIAATEAVLEAVQNHVDIPEHEIARSARCENYGLQALGRFLPSDLSTLYRTRVQVNSAGRAIGYEVVTLQHELDEILTTFNNELRRYTPQFLEGQCFGGMAYIEGSQIIMAGGVSYSIYSIEGIAIAEILQAIVDGEDPEEKALRVSYEIEAMFRGLYDDYGRGLWLRTAPRWSGGRVTYRWSNTNPVSTTFRTEIRRAMRSWESAAHGRIRFTEFNDTPWNWTLVGLGQLNVLTIYERNISGGGIATPGSFPFGISFMTLYQGLYVVNPGGHTIYSLALHELGHVLGLQHEHQRWDRDRFVQVTRSGLNYVRLPEVTLFLPYPWIEFRTIRIGFLRIRIPVIVIRVASFPQFKRTSAFDFNSIMIYSGLPIVPAANQNSRYGIFREGRWETRIVTTLSPMDKEFIRRLY